MEQKLNFPPDGCQDHRCGFSNWWPFIGMSTKSFLSSAFTFLVVLHCFEASTEFFPVFYVAKSTWNISEERSEPVRYHCRHLSFPAFNGSFAWSWHSLRPFVLYVSSAWSSTEVAELFKFHWTWKTVSLSHILETFPAEDRRVSINVLLFIADYPWKLL